MVTDPITQGKEVTREHSLSAATCQAGTGKALKYMAFNWNHCTIALGINISTWQMEMMTTHGQTTLGKETEVILNTK